MNGVLRPVDNSGHVGHTYILTLFQTTNFGLFQFEMLLNIEKYEGCSVGEYGVSIFSFSQDFLHFPKKLTLSSIYSYLNTLKKKNFRKTLWKKVKMFKMFFMQSVSKHPLIATFQLSSLNLGRAQNGVFGNGLSRIYIIQSTHSHTMTPFDAPGKQAC